MSNDNRFRFRAWDKSFNKYFENVIVSTINEKITVYGRLVNGRTQLIPNSHVVLEQCTGLKDKNGRLIYEGDIIKEIPKELCIDSYFYDEYTYKVVFWYGRFGYTTLDVNCAGQGDTFDFEFDKYDYEVVGNIHKNPELLEDK